MLQVGSVVPGGCRVAIPGRLHGYGCRPLRTSPNLSLRYRLPGRTGLRVSPLALGTMTFGSDSGWGARRELHRHGERLHQRDRGADSPGVRPLPSRSPRSTRCRPTRRRPRHLMRTTRSRQRHLRVHPARGKGTSAYTPLAAKAPPLHPARGKGTSAYTPLAAKAPPRTPRSRQRHLRIQGRDHARRAARGGIAGMVTVAAHPVRAPHPARAWPNPSRAAFCASRPTASTCATSTWGTA